MKTPVGRGEIKRLPPADPPSASLLFDSLVLSLGCCHLRLLPPPQRRLRKKGELCMLHGVCADVQK